MKIAAVQMVSTPRVAENLARARALIGRAADAGAELVALPEYFCLMGQRDTDKLDVAEADGSGPIQDLLAAAARECGVWLVGGTLPLRIDGRRDRAHNTTLVFGPDGRRVARYDKVHLFRFDDGERRYDEAATLLPGATPVAIALTDRAGHTWRVGLSICYDLRFPELYRALCVPPCDLLLVPAAFTYPTGQAHWELLLRARAVENQCMVLAPAQGGRHENGRRTWGHTMIVGPWGDVLAVQAEDEGVVIASLDAARMAQVRAQLPALQHRVL
ncbi:carbon-nitrogen hydrolase family protein [Methylibium petroleiphilum]|uniref:Putative nitrilase protein n=1 Tax=Methylibium petroleiphilum (strain ATCC BAA-1232 / LMG 22953 / PM1) TaxID=420662 RepID=A2SCB7_METPP|nr:carbon-nitrogen hydrolase family protein [Methylibium petroleiphilum]ABM93206.1 putative nitrilase protein [Methylibium petroleiphilum PM1]